MRRRYGQKQWYNTDSFYGQRPAVNVVDGLRLQMRRGMKEGLEYGYIVFFKAHGGKGATFYRIEPQGVSMRDGMPVILILQKRFELSYKSFFQTIAAKPYSPEALDVLIEIIREDAVSA